MIARVLLVDDDDALCEMLAESLRNEKYAVHYCVTGEGALEALDEEDFDVAMVDLNLGSGMSGFELCARLAENRPSMPVLVITGFGDMRSAQAAVRAGARDFLPKPIEQQLLVHALERACRERAMREQIRRLEQAQVPVAEGLGSLLGSSQAIRRVHDLIRRVAVADASVLLTGESGTGKEVAARALHQLSQRSAQPFVGINCAAMPSELLESELFGHAVGAFTDARSARAGLFEQAGTGTLLLDEIGEMPLDMQPKLLRALQERSVRPLGSNSSVPVAARIIAATNKDLEEEVEQGRFREDLFYRLNVIQIHVPPLRARGNDVSLLADHFMKKFAARSGKVLEGIDADARRMLLAFDWPGNVRQLENCIERAVALARGPLIEVGDLPERIVKHTTSGDRADELDLEHVLTLEQLQRRQVERVLRRVGGNKTKAAMALGIDRRTLYRKLERWGQVGARALSPVKAVMPAA